MKKGIKGVIMAGGRGTRLDPITKTINKHFLPVYHKPVIFYAIEKIVECGIDRIMIITSPESIPNFVNLLGSGKDFISPKTGTQIQIVYGIQNSPSGIAYGLHIARDYVGKDHCLFYLGDNIFEDSLATHVKNFSGGAKVFLKEVPDPKRFGVAELDRHGRVKEIVEKPERPRSNLAVTGIYLYDSTVFDIVNNQPFSSRGELEITYVNNEYAKRGELGAVRLKKAWFDVGTVDSLLEASLHMKKKHIAEKRSKKT